MSSGHWDVQLVLYVARHWQIMILRYFAPTCPIIDNYWEFILQSGVGEIFNLIFALNYHMSRIHHTGYTCIYMMPVQRKSCWVRTNTEKLNPRRTLVWNYSSAQSSRWTLQVTGIHVFNKWFTHHEQPCCDIVVVLLDFFVSFSFSFACQSNYTPLSKLVSF